MCTNLFPYLWRLEEEIWEQVGTWYTRKQFSTMASAAYSSVALGFEDMEN